jgi:hypothetical protein
MMSAGKECKISKSHASACRDRSTVGTTGKNGILENLGIYYSEWVERCYKERMKQILTDPGEFGYLLLEEVKRQPCLQDSTLDGL